MGKDDITEGPKAISGRTQICAASKRGSSMGSEQRDVVDKEAEVPR